jgi:hypothetical protein
VTFLTSLMMALKKQELLIAIKWKRAPRHGGEPYRLTIPGAHIDMNVEPCGVVCNDKHV